MPDIDPNKLEREIALQLKHGGYATPPGPLPCAEERARAILTLEAREDIVFLTEDEDEPWDGEAPTYFFCLSIRRIDPNAVGRRGGECLASLGMVYVNDFHDPYLRVCFAHLALEVLSDEAEEQERVDTYNAAELASRATYAGPAQPDPMLPAPCAMRLSSPEAAL
jgi:hypothetical protein